MTKIRAIAAGILVSGAVLTAAPTVVAEPAVPVTPVSTDLATYSAECAAGLLAGLIAALTTGSSSAVGCPT